MTEERNDIYLANRLFSAGERAFNDLVAGRLRAERLSVFVPQESAHNTAAAVTANGIFMDDYRALARCAVVLAVLDGETPDAGVACEIGLARAHGIPVIGLWSDFRQNRSGAGRPQLNIFIEGAIAQNGAICRTVDEAVSMCADLVPTLGSDARREAVIRHFAGAGQAMVDALAWLPGAYEPPFDPGAIIVEELEAVVRVEGPRVIDLGAGTGWLRDVLARHWPQSWYVPVDPAFGTGKDVPSGSADAVVLSFVLHDSPEPVGLLAEASRMLKEGGCVIVLDLTPQDLPRLVGELADVGALSPLLEHRVDASMLADAGSGSGLELESARLISRKFRFGRAADLRTYARAFGLDVGLDLPWLPLARHAEVTEAAISFMTFPFDDRRVFIACRLRKPSPSR